MGVMIWVMERWRKSKIVEKIEEKEINGGRM